MEFIKRLENEGILNPRIIAHLHSLSLPETKRLYCKKLIKRKKLLMKLQKLCKKTNTPFKYDLQIQLRNLDQISEKTLRREIIKLKEVANRLPQKQSNFKVTGLKNIQVDKVTGVIYLKSTTIKGEELERRLRGRKKKKLSKRAIAKKKANRNRGFWRPDKPTGMTQ